MERRDQDVNTTGNNASGTNAGYDNFPEDVYTGALKENISDKEYWARNPSPGNVPNDYVSNGDKTVVPENGNRENPPKTLKNEGVLDLVYGVLFEPARTFAGFAGRPPVLAAVVIVLLLNLVEALMGYFTTPQYMKGLQLPGIPEPDLLLSMLPLAAMAGFFFSLVKWFFMAGLLHLLAELYGGRGSARSVFTVYGLAGLPAALMIPVQLVATFFTSGAAVTTITGLLGLAVFIWSVALLVIGMREVHKIGTGKAVLTVFTPALAMIVLLIIGFIVLGSFISTLSDLVW